jgi:hypothetical protein
MIAARRFVIPIVLAALSTPLVHAQNLSNYRGLKLGMNLLVAAKQAEVSPFEAKVVSQRPAVLQELQWRPRNFYGSFERMGDLTI